MIITQTNNICIIKTGTISAISNDIIIIVIQIKDWFNCCLKWINLPQLIKFIDPTSYIDVKFFVKIPFE